MLNVAKTSFVGPSTDFVRNEILRLGAPVAEVKLAIALLHGGGTLDPRTYNALSPRMRRLVDLVDVGGSALAASICEPSQPSPADA